MSLVLHSPVPSERDYYSILGINRASNFFAINAAYRMLSIWCHPDQPAYNAQMLPVKNLTRMEYWQLLNEAYEVLTNPTYRFVFDMYGETVLKTGVNLHNCPIEPYTFSGDCNAIYQSVYMNTMAGPAYLEESRTDGATQPQTLVIPVMVTLEEVFYGVEKAIHYQRKITVDGITKVMNESLMLNIHPGTLNGTRLVKQGMGEMENGVLGDAYFVIVYQMHHAFQVRGVHLFIMYPISLKKALLGGTIEIYGIDGKKITVYVPGPLRPDIIMGLRGEGLPIINTMTRGELFIQFGVLFPTFVPQHVMRKLGYLFDMCS